MRILTLAVVLAAATCASATTVSYIDPFGAAGSTCSDPACDVIGNRLWYDLDRLSMTVGMAGQMASITIVSNFGSNDTLTPFYDYGIRLDAADLLFASGGAVLYGIPLTSHAGSPNGGPSGSTLSAGHLYGVQTAAGTLSAQQVIQAGSEFAYRRDQPVWLRDDGHGSVADLSAGSVSVQRTGDGVTSGRLTITVLFTPTPGFLSAFNGGDLEVVFASATCGNDILDRTRITMDNTPEPGSGALVLAALAAIGCRWRRRRCGGSAGPGR